MAGPYCCGFIVAVGFGTTNAFHLTLSMAPQANHLYLHGSQLHLVFTLGT